MQVFRITLLVALVAVTAYLRTTVAADAQITPGFKLNEGKQYTDEEKARMKANEDAARAARATLPDAKATSDPWAGARAAETPAKPKTVKPKATPQ